MTEKVGINTSRRCDPLMLSTGSPKETAALGEQIGAQLRAGDCLGFSGDLGAGKTTLIQGIVLGAGGDSDVRSPTFLLHAVHPGRITVHHLDLYRLPEGVDLTSLGLEEFLETGAAVVEWSERAEEPWFTGRVRMEVTGTATRSIALWLPAHLRQGIGG